MRTKNRVYRLFVWEAGRYMPFGKVGTYQQVLAATKEDRKRFGADGIQFKVMPDRRAAVVAA